METNTIGYFNRSIFALGILLLLQGCSNSAPVQRNTVQSQVQPFYSAAADEYNVKFHAEVKTNYRNANQIKKMSLDEQRIFIQGYIRPTLRYLFGPLTNRSIGGEQKNTSYDVDFQSAYEKQGVVYVPYTYKGIWIVSKDFAQSVDKIIPIPYNDDVVFTKNWKYCTDRSSEDHQDAGMYWYFWDPEREGCDQKLDVTYQNVNIELTEMTAPTKQSFPEYQAMLKDKKISMTFGFGYVEDAVNSDPFKSNDYGMTEFRKFISLVKKFAVQNNWQLQESAITEQKYLHVYHPDKVIGRQFNIKRDGYDLEIKVVSATEIDQMELFAVSFADEHDDFFGWFGHSRVGNGFDADQFADLVSHYSQRLQVTEQYQLVYWAGCNSYSYYTLPFFDFKRRVSVQDVNGTKGLDIISNGLPSLFSFNADNAMKLFEALSQPEKRISYQQIIDRIESQAQRNGVSVLINVLGDQDND